MIAESFARVTFQCVHFLPPAELPPDAAWSLLSLEIVSMDARGIRDEDRLLASIAAALKFPESFSRNRDALNDCLRDLEWLPAEGYVLIVRHALSLWRAEPALAGALLESWLLCAEFWSDEEVPFHLIFVME